MRTLLVATIAALALLPAHAFAFHPTADCDGAWSVGQVGRTSYVRATAVLERLEGSAFVFHSSTEFASRVGPGSFLISAPWGFIPSEGTYRVRLDAAIYDTLVEQNPSSGTLAAWPAVLRSSAMSEVIDCGAGGPALASTSSTSVSSGRAFGYTPSIRAGGTGDVRFVLSSGPPGMQVDEETGAVSWTPSTRQQGRHTVILQIQDVNTGRVDVVAFEVAVGS